MREISFRDNLIVNKTGKTIFACTEPIKKILIRGSFIFVLLDAKSKVQKLENVICVDETGKFLWKIENPNEKNDDCFANIYFEAGEFYAGSWSGMEYKVDQMTGCVTGSKFAK